MKRRHKESDEPSGNTTPLEPFSFQNVPSQTMSEDNRAETRNTESHDADSTASTDTNTDATPHSVVDEKKSTSCDSVQPDHLIPPEFVGTTLFSHRFKTRFLVRLNRFAANLGLSVPELIVSQFSRYLDDVRLTPDDIAAIHASEHDPAPGNEEG